MSGMIAAFNVADGRFLGNLLDASGSPIAIPGLWGLEFDNPGNNQANPSPGPALFFSAGINNYADGLFGTDWRPPESRESSGMRPLKRVELIVSDI